MVGNITSITLLNYPFLCSFYDYRETKREREREIEKEEKG